MKRIKKEKSNGILSKSRNKESLTQRGITLISLVITIIILLILAAVTIGALTGDNGILRNAIKAKEESEQTEDIEKIKIAILKAETENNGHKGLTSKNLERALLENGIKAIVTDIDEKEKNILLLEEKKEYKLKQDETLEDLEIDFDTKYQPPISQDESRNKGVLGIGTDGKPIDMDLWEYTLMDNSKYILNDEQYYDEDKEDANLQRSAGYIGNLENGKIVGTIPQYISEDNGKTFIEVESLRDTFRNLNEIEEMSEIPTTVKSMACTYEGCKNLKRIVSIPGNVKNLNWCFSNCEMLEEMPEIGLGCEKMYGTFSSCKNLKKIKEIPKTVITMAWCFNSCNLIEESPEIPTNVTDLTCCFGECWNLKKGPTIIGEKVKKIEKGFKNCQRLEGTMRIEAKPVEYNDVFSGTAIYSNEDFYISGDSEVLQSMLDSSYYNKVKIL